MLIAMAFCTKAVAQNNNFLESGCPSIHVRATHPSNPNADTTLHCGDCITLTAYSNATAVTANDYTVSSIPFVPPYSFNSGSRVNIIYDDQWADTLHLPFSFCFYGNTYNVAVVGTNGIISFNQAYAGGTCLWNYYPQLPIPNASFPSLNAVYGVYEDIDISEGGTVYMGVLGEYPCRAAIFNFYQIPLFDNDAYANTYQIVLYEGTNIIDVYIKDRECCSSTNNGVGIVGLQNATGTMAITAPGRDGVVNSGTWTTHNEAWRFTPTGTPNYRVTWYQGRDTNGRQLFSEVINNDTAKSRWRVCPTEPTDYTVRMEYVACNGDVFDLTSTVHINADTIKREFYDTCSDTPIEFGGVMRYTTGVYYDTVKRNNNYYCDSIIRQLTLGRISHSWDSVIACGRYVWRDGKTYTRSTVLPTFLTTNDIGCDSIIHLHLTMDYTFRDTIVDTICDGQQSFLGNNAYSRPGRYVDTLYSMYGCDSIISLNLTVIPLPSVELHNTGFDCETQTFGLLVQTTDDTMFSWTSTPYDLSLEGQERQHLIHVAPVRPTTYTLSAGRADFSPACVVRESILVNPSPKLEARIHRDPEHVMLYNTQMKFTDVSLGHVVQRWWTCERKDNVDTTVYTYYNYPDRQDSTWVKLVVRNEYLCYDSTVQIISVNYHGGSGNMGDSANVGNRGEIWLPNAFSPDLPTNKFFMAKGIGILEFHIALYNRAGQKVYESDDINDKWDGTYNGQMCQAGVYTYVLRYISQQQPGTEINRKGSVLLVR